MLLKSMPLGLSTLAASQVLSRLFHQHHLLTRGGSGLATFSKLDCDELGSMDLYTLAKTIHVISSTIVFGTGIGIAFFMFRSWFTENIQEKLYAAKNTVLADYLFTFPAVIVQPLSGFALIRMAGFDWTARWLMATYVIYIIAGLCWLPVVWIQIRLKKMCIEASENGTELPGEYNKLFKIWFLLGWPAFLGVVVVFYLMVAKSL